MAEEETGLEVASKHTFNEAFAKRGPIDVAAPELGEDIVVRFRQPFTVDDVLAVVAVPNWREPMVMDMLLARLSMVDKDGKACVEDGKGKDTWYQRGADGILLCRLSRRAKLREAFMLAFREREGAPSDKEVSEEELRHTIADLSIAMKIAPKGIRDWPAADLVDVLGSYAAKNKG